MIDTLEINTLFNSADVRKQMIEAIRHNLEQQHISEDKLTSEEYEALLMQALVFDSFIDKAKDIMNIRSHSCTCGFYIYPKMITQATTFTFNTDPFLGDSFYEPSGQKKGYCHGILRSKEQDFDRLEKDTPAEYFINWTRARVKTGIGSLESTDSRVSYHNKTLLEAILRLIELGKESEEIKKKRSKQKKKPFKKPIKIINQSSSN